MRSVYGLIDRSLEFLSHRRQFRGPNLSLAKINL